MACNLLLLATLVLAVLVGTLAQDGTPKKTVAVDSGVGYASKPKKSVDFSKSDAGLVIPVATPLAPDASDDTGAASDASSRDSKVVDDTSGASDVQTAAEKKLAWCRRENVSKKDCDSWVADQMARRAARKADERKRREERREDEEARRKDEEDRMQKKTVAVDSSVGHASKPEESVDSSKGAAGPLMLVATPPESGASDDIGASSEASSTDSTIPDDTSRASDVQTAADKKAEPKPKLTRHQQKCNDVAANKQNRAAWCDRQYVEAKECDKWVANECEWTLEVLHKKEVVSPTSLSTMLLAAAGESADTKSEDAWMNKLTADEKSSLQHELSWLDKKSQKEQALALKDGRGAAEFMRKEYVRKAADTIATYKKRAAEKAQVASEASTKDAKKVAEKAESTSTSKGRSAPANNADTASAKNAKEDATHKKTVAVDSSVGQASKPEESVDSSKGAAGPLMLVATPPESGASDDIGASSEASSTDSTIPDDTSRASDVQTAAEKKLAWCRRQYVSEKDCDSWVADQMARRATRKADEKKRREERRKDEEQRKTREKRNKQQSHVEQADVETRDAPKDSTSATAKSKNTKDLHKPPPTSALMALSALSHPGFCAFAVLIASLAGVSLGAFVVAKKTCRRCESPEPAKYSLMA